MKKRKDNDIQDFKDLLFVGNILIQKKKQKNHKDKNHRITNPKIVVRLKAPMYDIDNNINN